MIKADGVPVYCSHAKIVPIDTLKPNPENSNTHPRPQIERIAKVISGAGWRQPITVSKRSGFVVKGHGRLLAARKLGLKEVPIDVQEYASEAAEFADLVADNKLAREAKLDRAKETEILTQKIDLGEVAIDLSGYTPIELKAMVDFEAPEEVDAELVINVTDVGTRKKVEAVLKDYAIAYVIRKKSLASADSEA